MKARIFSGLGMLLAIALAGCNGGGSSVTGIGGGGSQATSAWSTYERDFDYAGTAAITGLKITMRDGVELSATATLPADANGQAIDGTFPVILTQTGYNKSIPAVPASNTFLVRHGYVHVSVDVRGTGMSGGNWEAFSKTEQEDYRETIDWVSRQSWSNGTVGTWGASFMGITQLFTGAWQHPSHKAIFAIVPMADAYRDIVFTGGQTNIGFIPVWMGLVTALALIPTEPDPSVPMLLVSHITNALTNFQVPVIAQAAVGVNNQNFDSEFWRTRSPIEVTDKIRIPTFIVGGLNDIFQRGEPLLYEALKGHTTTKLLLGPWHHVDASSGAGLPRDGVPDLNHIALQWFDQYLKGKSTNAERMPNVTQYLYGEERYVTATDWPHPQARAQRWFLHGDKSLSRERPAAGEASTVMLQQPVNGICSQSTSQWTAGILGLTGIEGVLPCFHDNSLNEALLETAFTTPVLESDYYFNGPIQADMFVSSTASDSSLLVRVTDVSPDGVSREITNGILVSSLRAVDETRSRFLDGQMIQPWHPFTAESVDLPGMNEIVRLPIEIFPTSTVIKAGHRLRITVSASDFPHGAPPLTEILNMPAGLLTLYSDAEHPSSVVFPAVPVSAIPPAQD